ncbi:DUF134 domain-containing protein [Methanolobus halotolerans]|uniref:UPF0251 protein CUN85_01895 n=1 Tax=Methanolobus halotolerans TaxID=2052935 RepID=A0A4E0QT11_9EURY|nr:DUF134 domain-containing protein [Methanolobus halotolerans]TGC10931.1 hypothetical protein CUN85_01895 [Methanolobus halotolerans]
MKCRGRPRSPRRVECSPEVFYFKPRGVPLKELETVSLAVEELEALRLVDVDGMTQEEAAFKMGVSRRAFWEDLQQARKKVALALTTGKAIEIAGGNYINTGKEHQ